MKVFKDILNQTQAKTLMVAGWKNLGEFATKS